MTVPAPPPECLEVARALRAARRVLMVPHVGIDGDDLGSMVGLSLALERLGVESYLYSSDEVPEIYRWLPGVDRMTTTPPEGPFDVALLMECPSERRLPEGIVPRVMARRVINFDHHLDNRTEADLHWVDPTWAALGEMAVLLVDALGVELDSGMAQAFYVAIMTDSGAFQYSNVRPRTHRIVARLVELMGSVEPVARAVYREKSLPELRLLGRVLETLQRSEDGRIAWADFTAEMLQEVGAREEHAQNLVEDVNRVRGAQVLALFKKLEPGEVRVSLRSTGPAVNEVAARFGGGGHRLAAGCTVPGDLEAVRARVLSLLREQLAGERA